ncbi:RRP15-like protein [Leptinotarsa decemlineata]|uniref:RRP15-like protein n=1 Tax=Leptinotarsa decemlineata TaxID=7539 RepID=UPI003D304873
MTAAKVIVQSESSDSENESSQSNEDSNTEENEIPQNSSEESDDNTNGVGNAGWANAISKVLKTKTKGKTPVLSKAKKLTDLKKVKVQPAGFEIQTPDGEVKKETVEDNTVSAEPPRKKKKELPKIRVKPNILEKDRERLLQRIATKGVVHFFNIVNMQQKDINQKLKEAGPLEVRKEKVMKNIDKRAFLDVLMGEKSQNIDESLGTSKKETKSEKEPTWSVLREDFMMGAKMKDWDKQLETEEGEEELEIESD